MVLVQNWPFFHLFFYNIEKENVFYDFLERKNNFLGYKNNKFKKSKKWHFFIFPKFKGPWFRSKIEHFVRLFLCNIRHENVFYDILERKNNFLGYKNKKFKQSKNWHFSKGLGHGFGPKLAIFPTFFFFGNIERENVFYDILERKNNFVCYKNKKLEKSKNWHFFKGVS